MDFTLPESLKGLNLPPVARSILEEALASAHLAGLHVSDHLTDDYVALAAGAQHRVAVYVHRSKFSIALDRLDADRTCREHPAFRFEDKTQAGAGYVHASYEAIDRQRLRNFVVGLIAAAFARSAELGPRSVS